MPRTLFAAVVCGLLFGCGGATSDNESSVEGWTEVPTGSGGDDTGTVSALDVATANRSGAHVIFDSYGERLVVEDTLADGHSAVGVLYNTSTKRTYTCWASGGKGSRVTCNLNFPDGVGIQLQACLGDNGKTPSYYGCSSKVPGKSLK